MQADGIRTVAIVLAAGKGKRMGGDVQKQYMLLDGLPLLYYSLKTFEESQVQEIILVTGANEIEYCKNELIGRYGFKKISAVVAGGAERYHSVYEGLKALERSGAFLEHTYVLIHDGARPFIDAEIVDRAIEDAVEYDACVIGMPVKDTIKVADGNGFAKMTPERSNTWMIQTPQAFFYPLIKNAYDKLMERESYQRGITDDAMALEKMTGHPVRLTWGSYENIKVTTPEDIEIADAILRRRKRVK